MYDDDSHNYAPVTEITDQYTNQMAHGSSQYVVVSTSNRGSGNTGLIVISAIVIGLILVVVLAGVLYVWASNLAEDQSSELVGDWTNPEDRLELKSNGEAKESTGTFKTWYTMSGKLFFEDDEYYWDFEYKVIDDLLFLAPYDENNVLIEEECIGYVRGLNGESEPYYNDRINKAESDGIIPTWCDY